MTDIRYQPSMTGSYLAVYAVPGDGSRPRYLGNVRNSTKGLHFCKETRFGQNMLIIPDFPSLFKEAELAAEELMK